MRKVKFLMLVILFFTIYSCHKHPMHYFDRVMNDYTVFADSSYWVYFDSANTANKDSIFLKSHSITYHGHCTDIVCDDYQFSAFSFQSSIDGSYNINGEIFPSGDNVFGSYYTSDTVTIYKSLALYYYFDYAAYSHQFHEQFVKCPDSLRVQNVLYKDVIEFRDDINHRTVFWSKHVGIIKSTIHGKTWELVRYNAKQ